MSDLWGSDVPISMPESTKADKPVLVDLEDTGFAFTAGGLVHNISEAQLEELALNQYGPAGNQ